MQRLALYTTLGLVLVALDQTYESAGFWCIVALFWASEQLTRRELAEQIEAELKAIRQRYGLAAKENADEQ